MAENVYLRNLREQYAALQASITGLQQRAAEAKRDLTNDELRSVTEQGEKSEILFTQIKDLSEIEVRNAQVTAMAGRVTQALADGRPAVQADGTSDTDDDSATAGTGDDQTRSTRLGGAKTQDRDPGFYTRSSKYSFVADQYRSVKLNDAAATDRLTKHTNALRDNDHLRAVLGSTGGAGLVPPVWLAEDFAPVLHRKLRVARALRQVPWSGPFPWSIPIAGTPATTAPVAEGTNPTAVDSTYTVLTVTPQTIAGYTEVSRQLLEAANPAVDAILWGDMTGDFYDDCETAVITALEAQASVNATTIADGAALPGTRNGLLDAMSQISDNSAGDPDVFAGRTARWTQYLKLADTTNRPLVVSQRYNPMNAIGEGNNLQGFRSPIQGNLEGLDVYTSPTIAANRGFVLNSQEHLFSMSAPMQFQFEQPVGPALVRVGVWGYMAVTFGRRPKAVTKITYTAN